MGEHRSRITRTSGMNPWRAGCGESCTSGSEGGLGKPAGGDSGTAPQSDPYTEHPTREGKVYCCAVLHLFSRKVVGWAIDRRYEATLVNDALSMAAETRSPSLGSVIHSDHGTQFTSWAFTENVRRLGLLGSMGTVGDCLFTGYWEGMEAEGASRNSQDLAA
jgi:putative transposase